MLVKLEFFFIGFAVAFLLQSLWWSRLARKLASVARTGAAAGGYNFTQRVREALAIAREEASAMHHHYVGTEHLLLGLLRGDGVGVAVLTNLKVDVAQLRANVLAMAPAAPSGDTGPDLPYTSRSKTALKLSMDAARELNHNYVGTEHLLLGLINERDGVAAKALANAGVTADNARVAALQVPRK